MSDPSADHGLTTLVFVDVERSTELLQQIGDDAGSATIAATLDLVRQHIEPYGGHQVKSLGDGLLLTFVSPRQAVSFALVAQRALAGSPVRVRFGINTGEVLGPRADPLGGAVNAAARIAARAAGGEVLVSDVVRQLVGSLPTVRFVDRGRCRLKGFSERWHLWVARDGAGEHRPPSTIGRVEELAILAEAVSSGTAGRGRAIFLEGEAGIGKTHLVREAVRRARTVGVHVIDVAADEVLRRPAAVPYGLLHAARGAHRTDALSELLTGAARAGGAADDLSYAVVEACVDLVESMSAGTSVLVVAEDLHWADDLSLMTLTALVRRAGVSRFAVIGTLRPTPRPVILDRLLELLRSDAGRHVRIDALDEIDVQALASSITGAAAGPVLRERLRATGGNPLFVTELLRTIDDDGLLTIEAGVADLAAGSTPSNLHETLVRRLSWLPHETNELLRLASLLGTMFTLHELAVVTGRSVVDVAAGLREASLAGLVVGEGDRLTFRHDLIREAVYSEMPPAVRRDLHRAAGTALARDGAPTQQIARQLALGALPGDLDAVGWLEHAAAESMSVSPSSALTLLDEAVALAPPNWPGRGALQARMIEPLAWCGRFDEAEAIADAVLASAPDPAVEFAALRGVSSVYGNRGNTAAAITALHRASSAPGAPVEEVRRLGCLAAQLSVLTGAMTHEDARRAMTNTLTVATEAGDLTAQCLAHQSLSVLAAVTGHGLAARDHAASALALFDSGRVVHASYLIPDAFHAVGLLELDQVEEAIVAADEARRRAEQRGTLALLPMTYMAAAGARYYAGRWDDALAEVEAGRAVAEDTGSLNFVLYYEALSALIATRRGDLRTAEGHLARGTQHLASGLSLFGADWLFGAQAVWLEAGGDIAAAVTVAEMAWAQTASIRYFYGYRARGVHLVRSALAVGRTDLARAITDDLEEGARRTPAASAIGAARLCRGLLDRDPTALLEAVGHYRRTALGPDLAVCCEATAGVMAERGQQDDAISLLREAAALYADFDAAADADRVDTALRRLGVRKARRRRQRPTFGWEALTPMELSVSALAAQGFTNPEIGSRLYISRRTVETHLSHVYTKLGFTSRSQLAAEVSRRAVTTP